MLDREKGIQAIIDLQSEIGITETKEDAESGWDSMSSKEQKITMDFHKMIMSINEQTTDTK